MIAADQAASGLAIDATNLYWTTSDGSVMRMPLDGSSDPIALVSGITTQPSAIALDDQFVYWTELGSGGIGGEVMKVALTGGVPEVVASNQYDPSSIAVSADSVYWGTVLALWSVPKLGGTPRMLVGGRGFLSEVDSVVVDSTYVYWNDDRPERVPLQGGDDVVLDMGGPEGPGSVAVDANNVYWTTSTGNCDTPPCATTHRGWVTQAPLIGGGGIVLAQIDDAASFSRIVVDADYVYWTTAHEVQRAPIGGGAIETLAANEGDMFALVVGPSDVFWASGPVDGRPAAIRSVAK